MTTIEVELQRRLPNDSLVADSVVTDAASEVGYASPTFDAGARTLLGAVAETAPVSDTASSGVNGRLQRIAQRLTSLIALLPASLGQKTKANSLAVTLASDTDALAVTGTFFQATQPVSLATAPTTPVTGTFWQATQPVSGPLTDAQLRATAVPVSGTVTATGALTDSELRATAVPVSVAGNVGVSGTVTVTGPLTDAQLRATAVPVSAASLPLPSGATTETTLLAVKRAITDYEQRLDYDARVDGNPVYVGKAPQATATSAGGWTVQKLTYDVSNRLTRVQVLTGIWDDRATLGFT